MASKSLPEGIKTEKDSTGNFYGVLLYLVHVILTETEATIFY